jgi:hypothetical protein
MLKLTDKDKVDTGVTCSGKNESHHQKTETGQNE